MARFSLRLLALLVLCVVDRVLSVPPAERGMAAGGAASNETNPSQDMAAFFNLKDDLTQVAWAHAVNSKHLLEQALNDTSIHMLEADVVLGTTPESAKRVPIMGHPPTTTSDLSLEHFLRAVTTYNTDHNTTRRGVKLDFKSIDAFESSIDFLKQTFQKTPEFPMWLNADILSGPVDSTTSPVDADAFLQKANEAYPELMLSLGWTTRWGKAVDNQTSVPVEKVKYSQKDVEEMINVLKKHSISQPITYAVRAAFVAHSLDELQNLLKNTMQSSGAATLTVWSSDDTDEIDVDMLRKNILSIGKSRVYLDVGPKLQKDLHLNSAVSAYASIATTILAAMTVVLRNMAL